MESKQKKCQICKQEYKSDRSLCSLNISRISSCRTNQDEAAPTEKALTQVKSHDVSRLGVFGLVRNPLDWGPTAQRAKSLGGPRHIGQPKCSDDMDWQPLVSIGRADGGSLRTAYRGSVSSLSCPEIGHRPSGQLGQVGAVQHRTKAWKWTTLLHLDDVDFAPEWLASSSENCSVVAFVKADIHVSSAALRAKVLATMGRLAGQVGYSRADVDEEGASEFDIFMSWDYGRAVHGRQRAGCSRLTPLSMDSVAEAEEDKTWIEETMRFAASKEGGRLRAAVVIRFVETSF